MCLGRVLEREMVRGELGFSTAFASERSGYEMLDMRRRRPLLASREGRGRDGEASVYATIVNWPISTSSFSS